MKILVTGATGFLGTAVCRALAREGHAVTALGSRDADLTRQGSLDPFRRTRYGRIYHLAAWTQAGDFCLRHPGEQWIINQQINTNVLAWWRARQPQAKLICMGSSCSYAPDTGALREEAYMMGAPHPSLYAYAMTKRMLYAGVQSLHRQFGMRYLCVVPTTLFGPGYHTDGRQMHFIFDLIRKIIAAKEERSPVVLWGDGYQRREVMLVDDFVAILERLAKSVDNDLVNVGTGQDHSIRQFAALICKIVGFPAAKIRYDRGRYVGARAKRVSIAKLRRLVPGARFTSLAGGIERTVRWFYETNAWRRGRKV